MVCLFAPADGGVADTLVAFPRSPSTGLALLGSHCSHKPLVRRASQGPLSAASTSLWLQKYCAPLPQSGREGLGVEPAGGPGSEGMRGHCVGPAPRKLTRLAGGILLTEVTEPCGPQVPVRWQEVPRASPFWLVGGGGGGGASRGSDASLGGL